MGKGHTILRAISYGPEL